MKKWKILWNLLGTLGASLLGNMLAEKGIMTVEYDSKSYGVMRARYGSTMAF